MPKSLDWGLDKGFSGSLTRYARTQDFILFIVNMNNYILYLAYMSYINLDHTRGIQCSRIFNDIIRFKILYFFKFTEYTETYILRLYPLFVKCRVHVDYTNCGACGLH